MKIDGEKSHNFDAGVIGAGVAGLTSYICYVSWGSR